MLLRIWRKNIGLNLREAADYLAVSTTTIWDAERGNIIPTPGVIARIEGGTSGLVSAEDHYKAWRNANRQTWKKEVMAGRQAARSNRTPSTNGKIKANGSKAETQKRNHD